MCLLFPSEVPSCTSRLVTRPLQLHQQLSGLPLSRLLERNIRISTPSARWEKYKLNWYFNIQLYNLSHPLPPHNSRLSCSSKNSGRLRILKRILWLRNWLESCEIQCIMYNYILQCQVSIICMLVMQCFQSLWYTIADRSLTSQLLQGLTWLETTPFRWTKEQTTETMDPVALKQLGCDTIPANEI